jgi:hypothetical protein
MKLKKLTKIEEDVIGHLGGILSALFGPRFSVDFSPLFGLRAFGKLLVLLYFSSFGLDLWALFGPLLDRTFHHAEVPVFEVLFLQGVARLKLSRVSGGHKSGMSRGGSRLTSSRMPYSIVHHGVACVALVIKC